MYCCSLGLYATSPGGDMKGLRPGGSMDYILNTVPDKNGLLKQEVLSDFLGE